MSIKIIAKNKKAYHDYEVGDKYEAGLVLVGTEVKSLRAGKTNLTDAWVEVGDGQAILRDAQISPYSHGNIFNHGEKRPRKLLLHKAEINRLERAVHEKGLSIVPTQIYFKDQYVKIEIAVARGKKEYDKRHATKQRDVNREIAKAIKR